jgi:hypothetical protein
MSESIEPRAHGDIDRAREKARSPGPGDEHVETSPETSAVAAQAYVWRRLDEIQRRQRRRVARSVRRLARCTADAHALDARLAIKRRALEVAERESDAVLDRPASPRVAYDGHMRALGTPALVLTLSVCIVADYLVDRGALQTLLLPLRMTQALALLIAVVQTLSAHTVGRLLRRQVDSLDPDGLRSERVGMWALVALVTATVAGLAVVRGARGSLVLAGLLFAVGTVAALVSATASYLHASTRVDAIRRALSHVRRAGTALARSRRRQLRAHTRQASAMSDLQATAGSVVAQVESVYALANVRPGGGEPAWIDLLRRWTRGQGLPNEGVGR